MSTQVRDAVLIVNPTAGGGRRVKQLDEARRVLRTFGIETELQILDLTRFLDANRFPPRIKCGAGFR